MTRRSAWRGAILAAGILAAAFLAAGTVPAPAEEPSPATADIPLPPGVRPFQGAITLRYEGFGHVTHIFRTDIVAPGLRRLAEGWVMEGDMRARGEERAWSYRLSNIGHDGLRRERGAIELRTDAWGEVREARIVEDRLPPGPGRMPSAQDGLFDAAGLRFPLCCCPRGPLRMGDAVTLPGRAETMPLAQAGPMPLPPDIPGEATRSLRSVVAGVLELERSRLLVIRHEGEARFTAPEGNLRIRTTGHTLLDTRTCLPLLSLWANRMAAEGATKVQPFAILHRQEVRF
jgi:hypothetical protein